MTGPQRANTPGRLPTKSPGNTSQHTATTPPPPRHHPGTTRKCSLNAIVTACNDCTTLIDDDWTKVADWYRLPAICTGMANDQKMYEEWKTRHVIELES